MTDISYSSPKTIDEAVGAMVAAKGAGRILAGGTDLLVQMRAGVREARQLIVDVKKIPEMIEHRGEGRRLHASAPPSPARSDRRASDARARPGPAWSRPST